MDRFDEMAMFARVAETSSFTKAATSLRVSRATVSVAIQQLEQRLGVRLLHRTTRRVSLTHEGERYQAFVRDVLSKLEAAEQLFQSGRPEIVGKLSLDVPTRIARRIIIPALPELLARHPGLELHLGASDRTVNLVETGVDAVIRVGHLEDRSLVARQLGVLLQVNCASPDYIARHGEPMALEDLDRHLVVTYGPRPGRAAGWQYVTGGQTRTRPVRSVVTVDNAEAYIASGLAGLGLIQVPAYDVRHLLESGALVSVMARYVAPSLPVALAYPTRRLLPARLRAFASWLTALFERHGMFERRASAARR